MEVNLTLPEHMKSHPEQPKASQSRSRRPDALRRQAMPPGEVPAEVAWTDGRCPAVDLPFPDGLGMFWACD